jgi:hypothetical protein
MRVLRADPAFCVPTDTRHGCSLSHAPGTVNAAVAGAGMRGCDGRVDFSTDLWRNFAA